ncbi:unnamed protein product, partial [Ostreobium quekettii]
PLDAMRQYQLAMRGREWRSSAVFEMVEIVVNPDNDVMWMERSEDGQEGSEYSQRAHALLDQVSPTDSEKCKHTVLRAYATMITKVRQDVEEALSRLADLAASFPNSVSVLLAMACGFAILKQTPKCRNQLKRIQ